MQRIVYTDYMLHCLMCVQRQFEAFVEMADTATNKGM